MRFPTALRRISPMLSVIPVLALAQARQSAVLDEGSFRVLVGGREIGREDFSIRHTGSGASAAVTAIARATFQRAGGAEQMTSHLQLSGTFRPVNYEMKLQGPEPAQVAGALRGNRFTAQLSSPAGERMREHLVGENPVLVDEGFAHHYYFVARLAGDRPVQIQLIMPREGRQSQALVTPAAPDRLTLDGRNVDARRITVQPSGAQARTVWVDGEGRVMRVEVPAESYVAERITGAR